mgnify:CR=1 FL=1
MWNLRKLEIDGLMSFGQATIDFVDGEVIIVYGVNRDAEGVEKSNGSGKSALLEGIGFGITGSPLRKVKIGELVNDDVKSATISVTLVNEGLNEVMRIDRVAYKSKSSVCQVFIGEEQIKDLTSTDEANKFIETKLGVVREDLLNFFILTAAKFTPFLDASDTKKKEIINRFSNGILVDKSIFAMEDDLAFVDEQLKDFQKQSDSFEQTLEALQSTLRETLSTEVVDDKDGQIATLKDHILNLEISTGNTKDDIANHTLDLSEVNEEIANIPSSVTLNEDLATIGGFAKYQRQERIKIKTELQESDHRKKHLGLQIEGSLECPKCHHDFDPTDENFDIKEAEIEYNKLDEGRVHIVENGKAVRQELDKLEAEIEIIESKISKISGKKSALDIERSDIENDITKSNNRIESNSNKIEAYHLKIDALNTRETKDVVAPLEKRIKATEAKLKPINETLGELLEDEADYKIQLDVFRRFKSNLANMSLKSMEGLVNDYLENFGSDIFLQLNSESKLANGKLKEKIGATLIRNGVDIGSFNKRSGGEKAAINLAFAKTLSHLINLNAGDNKGFNLLIIDEILDATDQSGMMKIVSAMEKSGDPSIVITHIPLPEGYGKAYTVVKEHDISRIL